MKALIPFSWVYGAGVTAARRLHARPKADASSPPRVISVGNLEAGGNGKTPLAMLLLEHAVERGVAAAYVSRGYRGRSVSSRVVACVPAHGGDARLDAGLRVLSRTHPDLAREIGDEGALVIERVPGTGAFFCTDKVRSVRAAGAFGAELVVLDDGFQSWRVARHVDVVLLDAGDPLDGGHLIPAGRLREPPEALQRADAIVFNGLESAADLDRLRAVVSRWLRPGTAVAGMTRRIVLRLATGGESPLPRRAVAVSAIARGRNFRRGVEAAGVEVAAHEIFRDHHRYTERDAARVIAQVRRNNADAVVTTEKDWTKLRQFEMGGVVWVARLDVSLIGDPLPVLE